MLANPSELEQSVKTRITSGELRKVDTTKDAKEMYSGRQGTE